jgi:phosphate transport system substrate-binding protein
MKMHEIKLKAQIKLLFSIILGIGITVLSFFTFVSLLFFTLRGILWILLLIFYVSIIIFLISWNKNKSKKCFIPLGISAMCIVIAVIIIGYNNYVYNTPSIEESEINIYLYEPFRNRQALVKLDERSDYMIIDNVPILDGATALYPVYAAFANTVYPEDEYDPKDSAVLCSKTIDAYNNLLDGKVDIIFCAGPSKEQLQKFLERGVKITLIPIGKEAFVFFVNKENNINNLTIDDIRNIYSGKIKNWKTFGGINKSIIVYQRPDNSGSQTALKNIMGEIPIVKQRKENVSSGMGEIINRVASYRNFSNAIGYSFLHFTKEMVKNDQIKILSINNIYPSKETIRAGRYPFCDTFYAIYVERDDINVNIKPFITWILSKQGQEIIEKTGYVSINNDGN